MIACAALACRCLIGLVFAVSAFAKLRNRAAYRAYASWAAGLPVPLAGNRALAPALAGAEAVIVLLVATPATAVAGLALAALLLAALTAGTAIIVFRGAPVTCRCFGSSQARIAPRHVLRNGVLLAGAVFGAMAADAPVHRLAGIALSLAGAAAAGTLAVFTDDIASLFERPGLPAAGIEGGREGMP